MPRAWITSPIAGTISAVNDKLVVVQVFNDGSLKINQEAATWDSLESRLTDIFKTAPIAAWAERLDAAGIPYAPIQTLDKVVRDPQTTALGIIQNWPGNPPVSLIGLPL